ncbi:MAG: thiol peroxidase [Gammaproteobacteria bacterium]
MANVAFQGLPATTAGTLPSIGSQAPDFIVTKTNLGEISLHNYLGRKIVLNIFPSLDTPTCASAMIHFNEIANQLPNTLILCISADLPFAQHRFCSIEHLDNVQPASVFRHPNFGKDYGVTLKDGALAGLLARAVVIIDEQGKVIYTQLVNELTEEPNYNKILSVLKKTVSV